MSAINEVMRDLASIDAKFKEHVDKLKDAVSNEDIERHADNAIKAGEKIKKLQEEFHDRYSRF